MELTPKEAITVIRNLQDWLYFSSMNGGTKIQREALDIAVNAIEKQIQAEDVTCENCDYSEKFVDGLILCRRTKTSHRVSATSTCGKGKREVTE